MNSNEQQIEFLISEGYHPADALAYLIQSYDPSIIERWNEDREQQIESLILQGYDPDDALDSVPEAYDPNFIQRWNQIREEYINYPKAGSFKAIFQNHPVFKHLNLSSVYKSVVYLSI